MRSDDAIALDVLRTIRRIVRRIAIHSRHLLRDVGLTVPQMVCLRAIDDRGGTDGVTVAEVSHRVQLSPATVSRIIDRLVAAGLVTRERSATDRRKVRVVLTAAGLERVGTLPTPLEDTFLRGLGDLPRAEQVRLRDALHTIANLMSAGDLDAAPLLAPGEDVKR
jgi:DNA-binding MarR family transcriptional regulator